MLTDNNSTFDPTMYFTAHNRLINRESTVHSGQAREEPMDRIVEPRHSHDLITTPVSVIMGVVGAVGFVAVVVIFDPSRSTPILATFLAMIYGVYLGFALVSGSVQELLIEVSFVAVGIVLTISGLIFGPVWIAVGLLLHGLWDIAHHHKLLWLGVGTVPRWYIPFCAVADILGAAAIFVDTLLN